MSTGIKRFGVLIFAALLLNGAATRAETVTLQSGNGVVGGTDSQISMLLGPADAPFSALLTAADFAAAQTGPAASIIGNHPNWMALLPSNANARWISTGPGGAGEGGTALYAIDFTLAQAATSATLDLRLAVDNILGGVPNEGVYINGTAISGNSSVAGFTSELTITRSDIAPLLVPGTNTLYINAADQGGPGGLIFSATIETVPIPEPGTLALLAVGLIALLACVRRRS